MESESIALPLGDTPMLRYHAILAKFGRQCKRFCSPFANFFGRARACAHPPRHAPRAEAAPAGRPCPQDPPRHQGGHAERRPRAARQAAPSGAKTAARGQTFKKFHQIFTITQRGPHRGAVFSPQGPRTARRLRFDNKKCYFQNLAEKKRASSCIPRLYINARGGREEGENGQFLPFLP